MLTISDISSCFHFPNSDNPIQTFCWSKQFTRSAQIPERTKTPPLVAKSGVCLRRWRDGQQSQLQAIHQPLNPPLTLAALFSFLIVIGHYLAFVYYLYLSKNISSMSTKVICGLFTCVSVPRTLSRSRRQTIPI